jgi:hypothetical protein
VIVKATEEVQYVYQENPTWILNTAEADPSVESNWNPQSGEMAKLGHYKQCILAGQKKEVPKKRN